jgi:hypothetical protein
VKYNNADVRQKFAKTDIQAGKAARQDFRGKDGQKVLEPDRNRPVPASVTGLLQAIVTGLPIVTGPPQLIVIGPLRAIAMDPA